MAKSSKTIKLTDLPPKIRRKIVQQFIYYCSNFNGAKCPLTSCSGSPWRSWQRLGDPEPMLRKIRRVIEKEKVKHATKNRYSLSRM